MWIDRKISKKIVELSKTRPAVLLTGARQIGKSSLLRKLFAKADYITLDRVAKAEEAEQNPEAFLSGLSSPALLDEIQYAPSLFRYLKVLIDNERNRYGRWIMTGSQKFSLMKEVSESLAGRVGILAMETLCGEELRPYRHQCTFEHLPWKGGYPELWSQETIGFSHYFESYVQTYLERDLQAIINVHNLRDFQRFMKATAMRAGHLLNYADLAKDTGVSQVTIKKWLAALEASGLIFLLSPYYRNMGKRLIKAPKLYFADCGLLSHLLDIENSEDFEKHIYRDHIWENFVFTELVKSHDLIPNKQLFYYRDQNGVEIDFLVERKAKVSLIEVKNSEKVDGKKLNFKKVAPLFGELVPCYVACRIPEVKPVSLRDYISFNPLETQLFEAFQ